MEKTYDNFKVSLLSEVKGKDKVAFIFELKLTSENNCRIKIADFEVFDIDGNKYVPLPDDISVNDVILGHSKFFTETKKVNIKVSSMFKSKIGCMAVLTLICVEDKKKMNFCFQRKGTNRWDMVGIQFLEYEPEQDITIPDKVVDKILENNEIKEQIPDTDADIDTKEAELIEETPAIEEQPKTATYSGVQVVQSEEGVTIVPIESKPAKIMVKKYGLSLLKQKLEAEGLEKYTDTPMQQLFMKYDMTKETLGSFIDIFKEYIIEEYKEAVEAEAEANALNAPEVQEAEDSIESVFDENDKTQTQAGEVTEDLEGAAVNEAVVNKTAPEQVEAKAVEYETEAEELEEYLNSIIDFDAKSADTIGLAMKSMRIRVEENGGKVVPAFYSEVSYSKETYVLVRCPLVKAIFYDNKGNIVNMAMRSVSKIYTGEDIVEMEFKKGSYDYWHKHSKIKIMVTL